MKTTFAFRLWPLWFGLSLSAQPAIANAQGATPPAANPAGALSELSAAFSGPLSVHNVTLSGTANWYAGSLEDNGTVNLTASDDGSYQMQLELGATGQITESQTGKGTSARCQWSGKDGVAHNVDVGNCWRPVLWFLPALSLRNSALSKEQGFTDLGQEAVGSDGTVFHHLHAQIMPSGRSSGKGFSALVQRTSTDIGLDPGSSLPAVLTYSIRPNDGAPISIPIEIHYSDYRPVDGVQIPFHIERYVNGSLQLDIHLNSAQIN